MSDLHGSSARTWDELALEVVLGERGELAPPSGAPDSDAFAASVAEQRGLVASLRVGLGCEPSGRVAVAVRQALARREALLAPAPGAELTVARVLHFVLRAAAVAAILIESQMWVERARHAEDCETLPHEQFRVAVVESARGAAFSGSQGGSQGGAAQHVEIRSPEASADALRAQGADVARIYAKVKAEADLHGTGDALEAENQLSLRRFEISLCASPQVRKTLLTNGNETWLVDERVTDLAEDIAERSAMRVASGRADTRELALAVRALIAAGSTLESGPYRTQLTAAGNALAERLPSLRDAELAIALCALTDVAVIHDGRPAELVAEHVARLVDSILHAKLPQASEMLSWSADLDALAEAGCVLRTAAAFGVPAESVYHARLLVLAHLQARAERLPGDRPDLAAAVLYGFGDLVDHDRWERRLSMVRARDFLPDGAAVMRFVWGRADLVAGWCDLQRELRVLATERVGSELSDASGLLLALSVNCAGPAQADVLAAVER